MFVRQQVPFTLHVDRSADLRFSTRDDELLRLIADSPDEVKRIKHSTRIARKRNNLWTRGTSPFVYFADADVVTEAAFFGPMIEALNRFPQLGMVGLCYQDTPHVACGSMMVRRRDLDRIGRIRGTGASCVCMYLGRRIKEFGLRLIPIERTRARELDLAIERRRRDLRDIRVAADPNGMAALPRDRLAGLVGRHGPAFRLYID